MESGLIYNIRSFSVHDGPGIRTTIFMKGCPLRCAWCHNPESQKREICHWTLCRKSSDLSTHHKEEIGEYVLPQNVLTRVLPDRPFFEDSQGGITLSGGEPLYQPDFCYELLKLFKLHDIHTAVDTSAFAPPRHIHAILPYTDLFLIDLKIMDNNNHKLYTGVDNYVILENFRSIYREEKAIIVRIPIVEGITDTAENLNALHQFLTDFPCVKRIDLLPFHSIAKSKYERLGLKNSLSRMKDYPPEKMHEIEKLFKDLTPPVTIGA
jgi:pyruvate formate lyase activating enzyme